MNHESFSLPFIWAPSTVKFNKNYRFLWRRCDRERAKFDGASETRGRRNFRSRAVSSPSHIRCKYFSKQGFSQPNYSNALVLYTFQGHSLSQCYLKSTLALTLAHKYNIWRQIYLDPTHSNDRGVFRNTWSLFLFRHLPVVSHLYQIWSSCKYSFWRPS